MLGAACRYRDVASHSSFESAGRELNSPSLTQQARNTWLWVVGRSQRRATIRIAKCSGITVVDLAKDPCLTGSLARSTTETRGQVPFGLRAKPAPGYYQSECLHAAHFFS